MSQSDYLGQGGSGDLLEHRKHSVPCPGSEGLHNLLTVERKQRAGRDKRVLVPTRAGVPQIHLLSYSSRKLIEHWNRPPREVVTTPSLSDFKKYLNNAFRHITGF